MRENILGINESLKIQGKSHPISFGSDVVPAEGYKFKPYSFLDGKSKEADGCVFIIEPSQSTRTVAVVDDFIFQDAPIKGTGWFLGVGPDGKVITIEFNSGNRDKMVEYKRGWIITWIAGAEGLEVISLNQPPFKEGAEIPIEVGSPKVGDRAIPIEYWMKYRQLKKPQE